MSIDQTIKPIFFEGQYLGSEDLTDVVRHAQRHRERHALGAHTWGIAAGLDLLERDAPDGSGATEILVRPGFAWDGYGRPIVVLTTQKLGPQHLVVARAGLAEVWLSYSETTLRDPAPGFQSCGRELGDEHSRAQETFHLEIGGFGSADAQESVIVEGAQSDPTDVRRAAGATGPLLPDQSVPWQTFPDGSRVWRIPLGLVRIGKDPVTGRLEFAPLTDDERKECRSVRRYAGVVAESIHAADGVVRIQAREVEATPNLSRSDFFAARRLRPVGKIDLALEDGVPRPVDLVWIEGALRVVGDTKLFGGKLHFREADGSDGHAPLVLERAATPDGTGEALWLTLGSLDAPGAGDAPIGKHMLLAGPQAEDDAYTFVLRDDGTVGIGTVGQAHELRHPLTVRMRETGDDGATGPARLGGLSLQNTEGNPSWEISADPGGEKGLVIGTGPTVDTKLFVAENGRLGAGTITPEAGLHLTSEPDVLLDASGEAPFGVLWHVGGAVRAELEWDESVEHLLLSTAKEFAVQTPAGRALTVIENRRVGVRTDNPESAFHVHGQIRVQSDVGLLKIDVNDAPSARFRTELEEFRFDKPVVAMTGDFASHDDHDLTLTAGERVGLVVDRVHGHVGIGMPRGSKPANLFHVQGATTGEEEDPASALVRIENTSSHDRADVLALSVATPNAGVENNFITFYQNGSQATGRIQGDGATTISFETQGADYAEWMRRRNPEEKIQPGDVIGVFEDGVSRRCRGALCAMVRTRSPIVLGNMPAAEEEHRHEPVAFLGQVDVPVVGPVRAGDWIVPSGNDDGTGRAVSRHDLHFVEEALVVGMAWRSDASKAVKPIRVAVGLSLLRPGHAPRGHHAEIGAAAP